MINVRRIPKDNTNPILDLSNYRKCLGNTGPRTNREVYLEPGWSRVQETCGLCNSPRRYLLKTEKAHVQRGRVKCGY